MFILLSFSDPYHVLLQCASSLLLFLNSPTVVRSSFYSVITSPLPTGSFPCVTRHQHLCVLHHAKHLAKLQNWRKVVFATRPVLFSFSSTIAIVDGHQPVQKNSFWLMDATESSSLYSICFLFSLLRLFPVSCFLFSVFSSPSVFPERSPSA